MKKIFTTMLLTLCAFIGLNAQKFEFRMNGEPVDDGETVIDDISCADVSYPAFVSDLKKLGGLA